MAFTVTEKIKILKYLGYPANTINPGTTSFSNIVNSRLLLVLPEAETEVREILIRIAAADTSLSAGVDAAGIKRIDDIEFFGDSEGSKLSATRTERNRLIRELATLLDLGYGNAGGLPGMGNVCQ